MNNIELALNIINLLNTAAPGIISLIMQIKQPDGTVSAITLLDAADKNFNDNIAQIDAWMKSKGKV